MSVRSERSNGLTLIELMVCICIIGIISSFAMLGYTSYRNKAKAAQALAVLKDIQICIELLAADTEKWPGPTDVGVGADNEVWDLNAASAGLVNSDGGFPGWAGPYIESVPQDPWGKDYFFDPDYSIDEKNFVVIGSFGPNKVGRNLYDSGDVILILPAE